MRAHSIVSNNKRHFPDGALTEFGLECFSADAFIKHQFHLNPDLFISVLTQRAADIGWTLPQLISGHVPYLGKLIAGRAAGDL